MNRPKKHNKHKRPQLWTHPLTRAADFESRCVEERISAQTRPFVIAAAIGVPLQMLIAAASMANFFISTFIISSLSWSAVMIGTGLTLLALTMPAVLHDWHTAKRLQRRFVTQPRYAQRDIAKRATCYLLATIAAYVAFMFVAIGFDFGFLFIMMQIATLTLIGYLITTGIHRRTGWDRRCAKCAYPHPDPKPYPITCPECGRTLEPDSHTHIILGQNKRSLPRLALGLTLLAALTTAAVLV